MWSKGFFDWDSILAIRQGELRRLYFPRRAEIKQAASLYQCMVMIVLTRQSCSLLNDLRDCLWRCLDIERNEIGDANLAGQAVAIIKEIMDNLGGRLHSGLLTEVIEHLSAPTGIMFKELMRQDYRTQTSDEEAMRRQQAAAAVAMVPASADVGGGGGGPSVLRDGGGAAPCHCDGDEEDSAGKRPKG